MTHSPTTLLLAEAERLAAQSPTEHVRLMQALVAALQDQDARIAALEAARPAHGLPLEGTGPLPLERRGQQ